MPGMRGIVLAGLLAGGSVWAAAPNDYVARWRLQVEGTPPVFMVEPGEEVLRLVQDPAFGDLQVFDAYGRALPMRQVPGATASAGWWQARFASTSPADGAAGDAGVMDYTYALPAPLTVEAVRFTFDPAARAEQVVLLYRGEVGWTVAARVAAADTGPSGTIVRLDAPLTAREWRIRSGRALVPAPSLQLAWRPARFLVRADGPAPYVLAVGHATARRTPPPADFIAAQAPLANLGPRMLAPFQAAPPPVPASSRWPAWLWPLIGSVGVVLCGLFMWRRRRIRRR